MHKSLMSEEKTSDIFTERVS